MKLNHCDILSILAVSKTRPNMIFWLFLPNATARNDIDRFEKYKTNRALDTRL